MQSGTKNPPWARSNVNSNMTGMNAQMMDPNNAMMSQQGMMPFQQSQAVYNPTMMNAQGGMTMPMGGQMPMNQMAQSQMYPGNVVAYPTPRALNPGMYQNNQASQSQPNTNEQRVFTGTITKTHNDFGFVDHDVFYQTSVCAKGVIPKVNDRVLVEATYNPNMPFKWNATRVQVLPKGGPSQNKGGPGAKSNTYNAVPPPQKSNNRAPAQNRRDDIRDRPPRREDRFPISKRSRSRSRSRSRDRRDSRRRDASPPRKRVAVHQPSPVKYLVRMPRLPLDITGLDVPSISQRYTNMYIPSDFFSAQVKWTETFPPASPFSLNNPCNYHIMSKDAEPLVPNDAVLEPADVDYRFSAKVMLVSVPTLELLYQKCGLTKADEKDKRSNKNPLHPTRLIKFLVGQKGKGGENFAIGGPWSPSLDGDNPQSDPTVLVRTAIRTCKALTGVDLGNCTQWYRMVEFYYWRESTAAGGAGRLETVVLFLPDVWSSAPTRGEWPDLVARYTARGEAAARTLDEPALPKDDNSSQIESKPSADDSTITIEENDEDEDKPEPTHYSKLDMKTIKVEQLRVELRARNASCKGLRPQLMSRLTKLIKEEETKEQKGEDVMLVEDEEADKKAVDNVEDKPKEESNDDKDDKSDKKEEDKPSDKDKEKEVKKTEKTEKDLEEEKRKIEKEKAAIKSRYELPTTPHLVVHPSRMAKGGKFSCTVATLSLLLDYRQTDNKEHSFEIFVFAELFNEMLMRDFGFYIYKTLYTLPEKVDDVKEKSAEKGDKKEEKVEKKEEKKDDDKKKDEEKKRDERRDSRRRDRRGSQSEEERSPSRLRKPSGVELPPDPYLLLSLAYFDTSRCGHIVRKDLQTLFTSLGLRLSRSQIRTVIEKVCVKDQFNYKALMQSIRELSGGGSEAMQDLPLDTVTPPAAQEVPPHIAELEATIAAGNRELLPVFGRRDGASGGDAGETPDVSASGTVMYKSRLVDVGSTLAALGKATSAVARLEVALGEARAAARSMRAAAAQTRAAERGAKHQLTDLADQLAAAKTRVASLTASSKIFHSALKSIQTKVEAVVNIKFEDDDVVEVVNGPTKLEKKDPKKETKPKQEDASKEEDASAPSSEQETESSNKDTEDMTKDTEDTKDSEAEAESKEPAADNTQADMEIDDKE